MDSGPGETKLYVIQTLELPEATVDGVEPGFNIDGNSDTVCGADDWTAPTWQGSTGGVDNQLAPFLSALVGTTVQESVDKGSVIILLEVSGINSYMNDSHVTATAYLGKVPSGGMPAHVGACATENAMDPNCRIMPGQTFDLDANSFSDGTAGMMPRISFTSASIMNGRLHAGPADFPLHIAIMGAELSITIANAQLDTAISATSIGDLDAMGHATGVLGGSINDMQLLDTIAAVPSLCSYVGTVAPILAAQSDLDPGVVTLPDGGMPTRCQSISIGIILSGVAASRGTITMTPGTDGGTGGGCGDGGGSTDGGGPG